MKITFPWDEAQLLLQEQAWADTQPHHPIQVTDR